MLPIGGKDAKKLIKKVHVIFHEYRFFSISNFILQETLFFSQKEISNMQDPHLKRPKSKCKNPLIWTSSTLKILTNHLKMCFLKPHFVQDQNPPDLQRLSCGIYTPGIFHFLLKKKALTQTSIGS